MSKGIDGIGNKITGLAVKMIVAHKPVEKIVIFGSRATGKYTNTSDIDIAIFGKDWSSTDINITKDKLEEQIKTPLKFDLVNFYTVSKEKLKERILREGRIIYEE